MLDRVLLRSSSSFTAWYLKLLSAIRTPHALPAQDEQGLPPGQATSG